MLVYSVGSRASFEHLDVFLQAVVRAKDDPQFVLVGNKCDLTAREVSYDEASVLAASLNCSFFETSAKTATDAEQLFAELIRILRISPNGWVNSSHDGNYWKYAKKKNVGCLIA
jgi:GTPase SAR1 family protein